MKKLETFYSRFGENVVGVVKAKAKPDGDINHLLKQLGLPQSGVLDRQHRTLVEFVQRYGRNTFMKAVTLPGGAIAVRRMLQEIELEKIVEKRDSEKQRAEFISARNTPPPVTPLPKNHQQDSSQPEASPPDEVPPGWIRSATYVGPDRRSGGDRRSGLKDRRVSCELITFKNRRFGSQRRLKTRRAEDTK